MQGIEIKKVKLIKGGEKLEVAYKETGELKATNDKVCDEAVHADLAKSVNGLAVHLAILTDYISEKQSSDKELIDKFVVTGYSIGGKEDEEGVTITGYRKTKSGQTVTLNSPFTRFEQKEESQYILMGELQSSLDKVESEVLAYLFEGKKSDDPQGSLFPDDENVTQIKIADEETEEEKNDAALSKMKDSSQANPEAMERLKEWDKAS